MRSKAVPVSSFVKEYRPYPGHGLRSLGGNAVLSDVVQRSALGPCLWA